MIPSMQRALTVFCVTFALSNPISAQDHTTILRVVDADGTPRPGVTVRFVPLFAMIRAALDESGEWITSSRRELHALRNAITVRSDPEGRAVIAIGNLDPRQWAPFVAGPFALTAPLARDGADLRLCVEKLTPFPVRVVDASGAPLAGFPVALAGGRKELALDLTDERGLAVFGMPKGVEARLTVVPAGWIGPTDGFPTVAAMLGREPATLVVPPYGRFRVRAVRAGRPVRVKAGSATLHEPTLATAYASTLQVHGFEFGPMALGMTLRGTANFMERSVRFEARGPDLADACAVHDVDLDALEPGRLRLQFRLTGDDVRAAARGELTLALRTDVSLHPLTAVADRDGLVAVELRLDAVGPARRLVRLDVDTLTHGAAAAAARGWSASIALDRVLESGAIDLGELHLEEHGALLSGRVIDERGQAAPRVFVFVSPEPATAPESNRGTTVVTDQQGRFVLVSPLLRHADGSPARMLVKAQHGNSASDESVPLERGATVELVLRVAKRATGPAAQAGIVAKFPGLSPELASQVVVELVDGDGRIVSWNRPLPAIDGVRACLSPGTPGRYSLRIRTSLAGEPRVVIDGLEVHADGTCDDRRLLRMGDELRVVTLRIVDLREVPIAGARAEFERTRSAAVESDLAGRLRAVVFDANQSAVIVSAPGARPQVVEALSDGQVVKLGPAGTLIVRVIGIPSEFSRDLLEVQVGPDERGGFLRAVQGPLGEGDVARVPLPQRGKFRVQLVATIRHGTGSTSSVIARAAQPIVLGDALEPSTDLRLSDAEVESLRGTLERMRR